MLSRTARITLAISVLTVAVGGARAQKADDPPRPPQDSKDATQAAGKKAEKAVPAASTPAAGAGGAMVFIDPATGKIVQPTAAQIGTLVPSPTGDPASKPPVVMIQGPGGAVGIVLTPESFSYSVATRTADGKIAMDCVTGDKAAAGRVPAGESPNTKDAPKAKGPLDEKK